MTTARRGAFICFEGIDHSGKTTHCELLAKFLQQERLVDCVSLRFPDRETHTGRLINAYLTERGTVDDRAVHLLFAANRWERRSAIEAFLVAGKTVIVDRYSFSGVAYTVAKGLDPVWCRAPENGLIAPDVVLYFKVDVRAALARGIEKTKERYETEPFQQKVSAAYEAELFGRGTKWTVIDSSGSVEQTQSTVRAAALDAIESAALAPLRTIQW